MDMATKKCSLTKVLAITVLVVILLATGCRFDDSQYYYTGEHPELFSIAINSILGTRGYIFDHVITNSDVRVVEHDDFGRTLFLYSEASNISSRSLVISQKSDDEYVYYIPHYHFISVSNFVNQDLSRDFTTVEGVEFPTEEIEELKIRNNWNQELDLESTVRVRIVTRKYDQTGPIDNRTLGRYYDIALGEFALGRPSVRINFCFTDDYGRSIYTAWGRHSTLTGNRVRKLMLFQPDGSLDESRGFMELRDLQRYQSELREFKELNDWNQPWE